MRKSILAATAVLTLSTASVLAESRTYDLGPFTRVDISTGLYAVIIHGDTQSVRIEAKSRGVLDQIEVEVRGDQLRARRDTDLLDVILNGGLVSMFGRDDNATIYITIPILSGAEASSGANVSADLAEGPDVDIAVSSGASIRIEAARADKLGIQASSGGSVFVGGACDDAELHFSSGARISARDLTCMDVHLSGSSGASAEMAAGGAVTGSLSSGANMRLGGTPETVNVESSSGGSLNVH